jgi:hypothetical protein
VFKADLSASGGLDAAVDNLLAITYGKQGSFLALSLLYAENA